MLFNRTILLNLLQMSENCEEIAIDKMAKRTQLSPQKIKSNLIENLEGIIEIEEEKIRLTKEKKIHLLDLAISSGISLEQIIETLHWREFESFCLMVLDFNNFQTFQNFHFSQNKRRYEIDVVGVQEPLIFAIDAKKWKTGRVGALKTMVKNQIDRAKALSKSFQKRAIRQKIPLKSWRRTKIIPIIVTSKMYEIKIFQCVPILPFFKLNQFINEYHCYLEFIMQIPADFSVQKSLFPK